MTYAAATTISPDRTRAEIERLVAAYGARSFISGWEGDDAAIMFEMRSRRVRFVLRLPDRKDRAFTHNGRGWLLSSSDQKKRHDQAVRSSWRALLLIIKAKLEAVESGVSVFETEFLAHIVIPGSGGQTVGEWAIPQIAEAYERGAVMPRMLPGAGGSST